MRSLAHHRNTEIVHQIRGVRSPVRVIDPMNKRIEVPLREWRSDHNRAFLVRDYHLTMQYAVVRRRLTETVHSDPRNSRRSTRDRSPKILLCVIDIGHILEC